jgi:hypothetical protein
MARIKPKQLLLQSKTKEGPTRISYLTIVTWNLIVILVVLSLCHLQVVASMVGILSCSIFWLFCCYGGPRHTWSRKASRAILQCEIHTDFLHSFSFYECLNISMDQCSSIDEINHRSPQDIELDLRRAEVCCKMSCTQQCSCLVVFYLINLRRLWLCL